MPCFCHIIRDHPGCTLLFCFWSIVLNVLYPSILSKIFTWAKTHGYCGIEFEERGEHIWVFFRCWNNSQFRRVCVSILDRFSSNVKEEVIVLGRILDAVRPNVLKVSVHGGPQALLEVDLKFQGRGYQQKLTDYALSDLRLFKRCLQRTTSSVFGILDPYSMMR